MLLFKRYLVILAVFFSVLTIHCFRTNKIALQIHRHTSLHSSTTSRFSELLRIGYDNLEIDSRQRIGFGSYGNVYSGILGKQDVVVKTFSEHDNHTTKAYLEVEEHCNKKLMRDFQRESRWKLNYFAPYLGHTTDANGGMYLVWKRTGDGTTLKMILESGKLEDELISIGIGTDRTTMLHELLKTMVKMVQCCHQSGICHRDVKPANILFDRENKTLRLIDFGSAADMKAFFRPGYDYLKSPCSPHYCAPEKFIDEDYPWSFDVFSIGMVWLRCIFPHLHRKSTWNQFHEEMVSVNYNMDLWLHRSLSSDAMSVGMLKGLEFFTNDGGRGWRLLSQMLHIKPKERITLENLLSDPYLVGAGSIVSKRSKYSKSFFETVIEEDVDVCSVEEHSISVRVSLSRPMGLELEQGLHTNALQVISMVKGGNAEKSKLIHVGDTLHMVGDRDCSLRSFDDVMILIKTFPDKKVPLVFDRGSSYSRPTPNLPSSGSALMRVLDMGVSSLKGQRTYMEDSYCMSSLTVTPFLDEDSYSVQAYLGAVFDGHRGAYASGFASKRLPELLRRILSKRHRISDDEVLSIAWDTLQCEYLATGKQSGSTAAAALIIDGYVHILNCGDSRVILTSKGHLESSNVEDLSSDELSSLSNIAAVSFVTKDHSATNSEECFRIESMGGHVECTVSGKAKVRVPVDDDSWLLGVTRSLGGSQWRNAGVIPTPNITSIRLTDIHENLIIASDGIWDVIDADTCAKIANSLRNEGKSASETAQHLCTVAIDQGTIDNMSIVVMYLTIAE